MALPIFFLLGLFHGAQVDKEYLTKISFWKQIAAWKIFRITGAAWFHLNPARAHVVDEVLWCEGVCIHSPEKETQSSVI